MPSSDYTPTTRGGLKLKGSSTAISKKKKKSKKPKAVDEEALSRAVDENVEKPKAAEEEGEDKELDLRELEQKGHDGKTATERAWEETRRKRVCYILILSHASCSFVSQRYAIMKWMYADIDIS